MKVEGERARHWPSQCVTVYHGSPASLNTVDRDEVAQLIRSRNRSRHVRADDDARRRPEQVMLGKRLRFNKVKGGP